MQAKKHKILAKENLPLLIIFSLTILIIVSVLGLFVYKSIQYNTFFGSEIKSEFNQDIKLKINQAAILSDQNEVIKFGFVKIKEANNPNVDCSIYGYCSSGVSVSEMPTILAELEYAGKTFKATSMSKTGNMDMSYSENGAYGIIPYNIELINVDFDNKSATVKITKKDYINVEFGKQFTLKDNEIAILEPKKTGVHVKFGNNCNDNYRSNCFTNIESYINGKPVYINPMMSSITPSDMEIIPEMDFPSKNGSFDELDGIRLKLIKSDNKTYATFIFEKI